MLTWWAWARPDERNEPLLSSMVRFVLPFTLWTMLLGVVLYSFFNFQTNNRISEQELPPRSITYFERATGLTYGADADFNDVVVTLIAQSNLSLCYHDAAGAIFTPAPSILHGLVTT